MPLGPKRPSLPSVRNMTGPAMGVNHPWQHFLLRLMRGSPGRPVNRILGLPSTPAPGLALLGKGWQPKWCGWDEPLRATPAQRWSWRPDLQFQSILANRMIPHGTRSLGVLRQHRTSSPACAMAAAGRKP